MEKMETKFGDEDDEILMFGEEEHNKLPTEYKEKRTSLRKMDSIDAFMRQIQPFRQSSVNSAVIQPTPIRPV